MNDEKAFQEGIGIVVGLYSSLSADFRTELDALIEGMAADKAEMARIVCNAGSPLICSECLGQCCLNGKYRLTVLDAISVISTGVELPKPDFRQKPLCPYSGPGGCLMGPETRPLDCILFICDRLDSRIDDAGKTGLETLEQKLRGAVAEAWEILKMQPDRPLLLVTEGQI